MEGEIVTERLAHLAALDGHRPFCDYGEDGEVQLRAKILTELGRT